MPSESSSPRNRTYSAPARQADPQLTTLAQSPIWAVRRGVPDGATPDRLCRLGCVGSVEPLVTQAFEEPSANDCRALRLAPAV